MDGLNFGAKHLDAHLSALAQLALCVPDVFEEYHTTIVNFIVKELLLKNRVKVYQIRYPVVYCLVSQYLIMVLGKNG